MNEIYFKKKIEELKKYKGTGTQMISFYVPFRKCGLSYESS